MNLKLRLQLLVLGVLFPLQSHSVSASEQAQIPIVERGSWGYINNAGKTIIGPQYDRAEPFKNGFASVCPTGKSISDTSFQSIITTSGKALSPLLFFEPGPMNEGFAVVHTPFVLPLQSLPAIHDVRAGYISKSGQILPTRFHVCGNYSNGVAVCGTFGLNKPGSATIAPSPKEATGIRASFTDGYNQGPYSFSYFLIDRAQKKLAAITGTPVDKPPLGLFSFSQGKMPVKVGNSFGFIDTAGKLAIQPRFAQCLNFQEGFAAVRVGASWGFINESGKLVIPCTFKRVSSFHDGLAKVETSELSGFIDKNNKLVFQIQSFDDCSDFSEGIAVVRDPKGSVFLSKQGRAIYRTQRWVGTFHEGLCVAVDVISGRVFSGYLNRHFAWVIKPQFVRANDFSEGFAAVCFYDAEKEAQDKRLRVEIERKSVERHLNRR